MKTALICVDVQFDFMPASVEDAYQGALAVLNGRDVIEPLVQAAEMADIVVVTGDQHTPFHVSFAQDNPDGKGWPVHCVRNTYGAQIHPAIAALATGPEWVIDKATEPDEDAYSAFKGTGLADKLHAANVTRLIVGGLATNYCVLETVRDGLAAGFEVTVLADASRAVGADQAEAETNHAAALAEMETLGATIAHAMCRV